MNEDRSIAQTPRVKANLRMAKPQVDPSKKIKYFDGGKAPHAMAGRFAHNIFSTSRKRTNVAIVLTLISSFLPIKAAAMVFGKETPNYDINLILSFLFILSSIGAFLLWKKEKMPLFPESNITLVIYYSLAIIAILFPNFESTSHIGMLLVSYYAGPVITLLLILSLFGRTMQRSKQSTNQEQLKSGHE